MDEVIVSKPLSMSKVRANLVQSPHMVAHAGIFNTGVDPHIRQIDPWRDGRTVANLLESSFREEIIDEGGARMLNQLRNYGVFEALSFGFGTGFVWVEEGEVVANASVQRNFTRRDTWMIGNVATRADLRNRGIGRAVVEACIQHAARKGARTLALQVDAHNKPALHLYEKAGFVRVGEVTHYLRPNARQSEIEMSNSTDVPIRTARWSDRAAVWALTKHNIPDALTYAESFDNAVYRLGFQWSLTNSLNGNPEQWHVVQRNSAVGMAGAVRTRANIEGNSHHLELMLGDDATREDGIALIERGLTRLERYISKPVYAAQSLPHTASHDALPATGFVPKRTLVHMRLTTADQ